MWVMKLSKIQNVTYRVDDVEKSAKFYTDLGMSEVFRDGNNLIGLSFPDNDSQIVVHTDVSKPKYDFSFLVDNVEDFCKEYKEKGYTVKLEPVDVRSGKYAILFDPDGNIVPIIDRSKTTT